MNLVRLVLLALIAVFVWRLVRRVYVSLSRRNAGNKPATASESDSLVECPVCKEYLTASAKPCGRPTCPRLVIVIFLCAASLFGAHPAQAEDGGRYLMEISGAHVSATLEINDVKVGQWTFGQAASAGLSFNHWLRTGANTIRLTAAPGQGAGAVLQARLYFLGLTSAGGMNAVNLINVTKLADIGTGKSVSFNVPTAPALALWQAAPAELNDAAKASIRAVVEALHSEMLATFQKGGTIIDVPALAPEFQDMASAYGSGNAAATSRGLVPATEVSQDKLESAGVPDLDDLEMMRLAGGQLVRVGRHSSGPLLGVRGGGREMVISALLVGQVDGVWRVLRRAE